MSMPEKLFSVALTISLVFGVGLFTVQAQSNLNDISISSASTAELQIVLSNLQQQVNDLYQRVVDNTRSESRNQSSSAPVSQESGKIEETENTGSQAETFNLSDTLGVRSTGQEVRWVQRLLVQKLNDEYSDNLITGFYGDATADAVSRIQRQAGLDVTGEVNEQTLDYLQNSYNSNNNGTRQESEQTDTNSSYGAEQKVFTLTDEYLDTYTFTATLTHTDNASWQYNVTGRVPNPNHTLDVTARGIDVIATITPTEGPAISQVSEVSATGQITAQDNRGSSDPTFEVRQRNTGNEDNGSTESDVVSGEEQLTLSDTFLGTYEFTATVTRVNDSQWRYSVDGSTPSPNYDLLVTVDGSEITAQIKRNSGAAPTVVSDLAANGSFSTASTTEVEDISFEVREVDNSQRREAGADSATADQAE